MRDIDIFVPSGGMDLDSDEQFIAKGDTRKNLNVRHLTDNTGSSVAIVPIKGNTQRFHVLPVDSTQNKKFRIYVPSATSYELDFLKTDGSVWFSVAAFTNSATGKTNIDTAVSTASQTATTTVSGDYIFVEITSITAYEYSIESTGADTATIVQTQEAYDADMVGDLHVIGSYDLLGDLFLFSAVARDVATEVGGGITATASGLGLVRVTTASAHGLITGCAVSIIGSGTEADGYWIVSVVSTTQFDLLNSTFALAATTGTITRYTEAIGEIGVVVHNESVDTYVYTRLLRSKELGFRRTKQIDSVFQKTGDSVSGYFVDHYNDDRVFYFDGAYGTDYAISTVSAAGRYTYGSIDDGVRMNLRNTGILFDFLRQDNYGGAISAGNWRYAIRFLTEGFDPTPWLGLTNEVPVYEATDLFPPEDIYGNEPDFVTTKINILTVENINAGLFKYIELAGVNYIENTFKAFLLRRDVLPDTATSVEISHTGFESDVQDYDAGLLIDASLVYQSSKNINIIDKRLVRSNLTLPEVDEFANFCLTFTHALKRKTLDGCQRIDTDYRIGEFQIVDNINDYVGAMLNETYRFGARFELINGYVTQDFYIDDIIFNCSATNSASIDPTRRTGTLASFDLTDNSTECSAVYSFYVEFGNINLDYVVNGKRIKDFVKKIIFTRRELNPSILASGIAIPLVNGSDTDGTGAVYTTQVLGYMQYPMLGYEDFTTHFVGGGDVQREDYLMAYFPDNLYGELDIVRQSGDVLLNVGCGVEYNTITTSANHRLVELNGYTDLTSVTSVAVDSVTPLEFNGTETINGLFVSKWPLDIDGNPYQEEKSLVIEAQSDIQNVSANADYGWRQVWYKRPFTTVLDQYGAYNTGLYETTGTELFVDNLSGTVTADVYPRDVMTQKMYIKERYAGSPSFGYALGYSYYAQNRINCQMKLQQFTDPKSNFPGTDTEDWLESYELYDFGYNSGYSPRNGILKNRVFDSDIEQNAELPTRIIWSPIKGNGLSTDPFRINLPLDLFDLDQTYGPIVHHDSFNGELVTWQQRKFQRQYFNTRGTLTVSDGAQVLLGGTGVLSRDGSTLTQYGAKQKWGIIKGRSPQGNDQFYWLNTEYKKFIRLGYDGTVSLSDMRGMRSFLANNVRFVEDKDTPADFQGVLGVWNERYSEVILSVNAYNSYILDWQANEFCLAGTIKYREQNTFDNNGYLYECLENNLASSVNEPGVGAQWRTYWRLIDYSNTDYYSRFTVVFNEMKNKFTSFNTPVPRIYIPFKDGYFTMKPTDNFGLGFKHDEGDYCSWYEGLTEDGYLDAVINKQPMEIKQFEAIRIDSQIAPYRMDFAVNSDTSFLHQDEFEDWEGSFMSPVKEKEVTLSIVAITTLGTTVTITTTTGHNMYVGAYVRITGVEGLIGANGIFIVTSLPAINQFTYTATTSGTWVSGTGDWSSNDLDTGLLFGNFLKAKMYFQTGVYQKLVSLATKFSYSPRYVNK